MDAEDQKLEVIRKLLAKAEKAGTPDEADTYNAKAAELMARHGVDTAMVATAGEMRDVISSRRIAMTDPYSTVGRHQGWRRTVEVRVVDGDDARDPRWAWSAPPPRR